LIERLAKPVIDRQTIEKKRAEEREKMKESIVKYEETKKLELEAARDH
jgi:hypothetical protein